MRQRPRRCDTIEEALRWIGSRLSIGLEHWLSTGWLLRHTLTQRKLTDFT
ncbi:MAG: hypothetical protein ACE5OO_08830 [Candidatus Bathyarchaeia archaeon]